MEALISALTVGGGSIFGGILSLGTQWISHRQNMDMKRLDLEVKRFDLEARAQEMAHERELIPLEMARNEAETEAAIELADTQGSWSGLQASYAAATSEATSYRWVDATRTLVRPVLTLGGIGALIGAGYGFAGPEAQSVAADTMLITAQTSVTWWFGDRAIHRART